MWIASQYGFFSIVRKMDKFHVRARKQKDLKNLLEAMKLKHRIVKVDEADYRFRIVIDEMILEMLMQALTASVTYDNFKSKIATLPDQRDKLHAYHGLWADLEALQPKGKPGTSLGFIDHHHPGQ